LIHPIASGSIAVRNRLHKETIMKLIKRIAGLSIGVALVIAIPSVAWAQDKRPMTIVDLIDVPFLSDPQLSPDGKQVLYVLSNADWKENKRINHIWRVNADGSNPVQMTNGETGENSPRWSPDGKWIAFIAVRDETEAEEDDHGQIFLLSNVGGEAQPLTEHETAVSRIQWSPDGAFIYFTAAEPDTEEEKEKKKAKDDVYAFDEDYKQLHLWKIAVSDKKETRITEGDFSIIGYELSRDGSMIAHHRAPSPLFDDSDEGEVWVMKADGSGAMKLTDNTVAERGAELSPDNQTVLFLSDSNASFVTYYNDNVFLVPAAGGDHRIILEDMPHEVMGATWSSDGKAIYFGANTGVRSELFSVEVATEKLEQLTRGDHSIFGWDYVPSIERHVFTVSDRTNAGDLWMLDRKAGAAPIRVTHVYDYLDEQFQIPRQEAIQWKGEDGVTVEGLLYYPLDYEEGKAYPLCVQTHGGPMASDKFGFGYWANYVPVLAARGWAVFKPNYRGSTGYGDDFLRDMVGHYYRQSHLDVMTGVDYLIEKGIADGDRMAKMGWSGGGHMTNKIITHTDRFKAAASGAGAVNWISMYGQSDVRIYRTPWFGGTPWQKDAPIDVYWDHSPLKDIWKVKTPTIVLVGENDVRVPPPQSVELYRALKTNGVPAHLYMAPREPHGWRELRHELFKVNVELDWFEKHALGREYTWEKAPSEDGEAEGEKPTTQN
jgi:dipeptidyl aminopeptidase/acylaminoacyl peptidase